MEAFRSGGGVPLEAYGADTLEAINLTDRPMFVNDYVAKWIPAMPDIETRLKTGGRVAEIVGWFIVGGLELNKSSKLWESISRDINNIFFERG
jgi:hypothetical protein